ncbi:redoxin domain-containing protein [Chitinophaga sp.]|uniref:redoxin domain-containing protein n=1 Tax=Chitinophaga sp. TaxID=1869181 RepID=UPI002F94C877
MKIMFNQLHKYMLAAGALLALPLCLAAQSANNKDSLRAVITAHPDNIAAHEAYLQAAWKDSAAFVKQYQLWMKQYPKAAAVPYAYGKFYANRESPAAKPFLLKAVAINPKLAVAWEELAIDAERWGDFKKSREYLANAVAAEPDNADYLSSYAYSFQSSDPEKYLALSKELIQKFPESQRSAQSLYWLAFRAADKQKKLAYYEQLRKDFPVAKFDWSQSAMSEYFDVLLADDPAVALQLMSGLVATPGLEADTKSEYEKNVQLATQLVQVQKLLGENNAAAATEVLTTVKVKRWGTESETVALLKAKVAAQAGGAAAAYDTLLKYYVKTPARSMKEALMTYAEKAGKSTAAVYTDIRQKLTASAKAASFNLDAYLSSGKVTMNDYKGKVVLLTFWFPGCGPCRGEFPHFESVLKNFKSQPVSYVGINIVADQDEYVVPFIKTSGYSFTPLRDVEANRHNLPVRGAPTNYLIDQNGRIIFSNFMIQNHDAELMLQDMIQLLLEQKA